MVQPYFYLEEELGVRRWVPKMCSVIHFTQPEGVKKMSPGTMDNPKQPPEGTGRQFVCVMQDGAQVTTGGICPLEPTGRRSRFRGCGAAAQSSHEEILIWVELGVNKSVDSRDLVHAEYEAKGQDYIFQLNAFWVYEKNSQGLNQTPRSLS